MIGEGNEVALRRNARMADPAAGLVKRFTDRVFEPVHSAEVTNYKEIRAIG
jgi:hypothetical protein